MLFSIYEMSFIFLTKKQSCVGYLLGQTAVVLWALSLSNKYWSLNMQTFMIFKYLLSNHTLSVFYRKSFIEEIYLPENVDTNFATNNFSARWLWIAIAASHHLWSLHTCSQTKLPFLWVTFNWCVSGSNICRFRNNSSVTDNRGKFWCNSSLIEGKTCNLFLKEHRAKWHWARQLAVIAAAQNDCSGAFDVKYA